MVFAYLKASSTHFMTQVRAIFSPIISKHRKPPCIRLEERSRVALYDARNIANCPWPQTAEGQYAKNFLAPIIEKKVHRYIENIHTDLKVLILDELVLPITVNETEYNNSYVCSPYSYFISYARESLNFISPAWISRSIDHLLGGLGGVLRTLKVNKVVVVNNWLCSTNLYPSMDVHQLASIIKFLKNKFPGHTLLFRSVDVCTNKECYEILRKKGFEYIASRQIYFLDPKDSSLLDSRLFKSDLKLLKGSGYEVVGNAGLTIADIPRLLELYRDLYIQKYSQLNPAFNSEFLRLMLKDNLLQFKALKKEGRIEGVVGYMVRNGKMYCPFFGYDRSVPKEKGLYRLLSTLLIVECFQKQLFFHQSSGASMYKKIRKAGSCIDYTVVDYRHLPFHRRIPWILLKCLYNTIGKRFMQNY